MKSKSELLSLFYWSALGFFFLMAGIGSSFAQSSATEVLQTEKTTPTTDPSEEPSGTEASTVEPGGEASPQQSNAPPEGEGAPAMDGATYQVRLRNLEQKVDALKEQIRRSHTRLSLLSDTILSGASGGAKAIIQFDNELSGAWRLVEAVFVLDGAIQYKRTDDTGILNAQREIPIFEGSIPSGDHTLQVMFTLKGQGFGVFSYMKGIEATVKSSRSFSLSEGKIFELKATLWEKGGPTTPVDEQPSIRFDEQSSSMTQGAFSSSGSAEKNSEKSKSDAAEERD